MRNYSEVRILLCGTYKIKLYVMCIVEVIISPKRFKYRDVCTSKVVRMCRLIQVVYLD